MLSRGCGLVILVVMSVTTWGQQNRIDFAPSSSSPFPNPSTYSRFIVAPIFASPTPDVVCTSQETADVLIVDIDTSSAAGTITIPVPAIPKSVAGHDFDGDGDIDLVVSCVDPSGAILPQLSFLRNDGGGTFTRIDHATIAPVAPIHLADLDGDGIMDVICGKNLFIGQGNGTLFPAVAVTGGTQFDLRDVIPADFDGDGDRDLLIVYFGSTAQGTGLGCRFLRRNASGTYTTLGTQLLCPATDIIGGGSNVDVGDMNEDGCVDVVHLWQPGAATTLRIQTFFTTPTLGFTTAGPTSLEIRAATLTTTTTSVLDLKLELADISGDGHLDAVFGMPSSFGFGGNQFVPTLLENDGDGALLPFQGTGIGGSGMIGLDSQFAVLDFDSDGDADVVWRPRIFNGSSFIRVALNASGEVSPTLGIVSLTPKSRLISSTTGSPSFAVETAFFYESAPGINAPLAGKPFIESTFVDASLPATPSNVIDFSPASGLHRFEWEVQLSSITSKVRVEIADGEFLESNFYRNYALAKISGDVQAQCVALPFSIPLVVRATDAAGAPIVGANFVVTSSSTNIVTVDGTGVVETDAFGDAVATVAAGWIAGATTVVFEGTAMRVIGYEPTVTVPFSLTTISNESMQLLEGDDQVTLIGTDFPNPITVRMLDCLGNPIFGRTVHFSVIGGPPVFFSSATATTDSFGIATVTATAGAANGGLSIVRAEALVSAATIQLGTRGLFSIPAPGSLQIRYDHEHFFVPLLLAVDTPLPAPGYVSSFLGNIHTSILAPGPDFLALDGLGLFGPPDPSMMTNVLRRWSATYALPPFLGITLVAQVYGYDPAYLGIDAYFISNPVTFTL